MAKLLAVDLGFRAGLAVYGDDGRLLRYGSRNFVDRATLKRAVPRVLAEIDGLVEVVLEGDRDLGLIWAELAHKRNASARFVSAEAWRQRLLLSREQRSGKDAKRFADALARRIIAWSSAKAPTSLRHDAAEAIVLGFYACIERGWIERVPDAVAMR